MSIPECRVYLLGFMGAGKTSTGEKLSRKLGWPFTDLDNEIVRDAGMSIPSIFDRHGEEHFRRLERRALRRVSRRDPPLIVAGGGGLPLSRQNRETMRATGVPVFLAIRPETALERIGEDPNRPLLETDPEVLDSLWEERREAYARLPHRVEADCLTLCEVVQAVLDLLENLPEDTIP